jgi:hypothetical protein
MRLFFNLTNQESESKTKNLIEKLVDISISTINEHADC